MYDIRIFRWGAHWYAKSEAYRDIMGTDTVPTAFRASADSHDVLRELQRRNPSAIITVGRDRDENGRVAA